MSGNKVSYSIVKSRKEGESRRESIKRSSQELGAVRRKMYILRYVIVVLKKKKKSLL